MCLRLIFAREVKVDIGGLFISRETEEGLKRDIKAVLPHERAALGAVFRRHVRSAAVRSVGYEFRVSALGADIVRRQGVDLGDAGHIGNDRRADAASAADEVSVLERILHQLLCAHVDDIVAVVEVLNFGN